MTNKNSLQGAIDNLAVFSSILDILPDYTLTRKDDMHTLTVKVGNIHGFFAAKYIHQLTEPLSSWMTGLPKEVKAKHFKPKK